MQTKKQKKHLLIFQTPNCPDFQPIELLWAYVKRYVASSWKENRAVEDIINQHQVGFYGGETTGGGPHLGALGTRCRMYFEHSLRKIALVADQDEHLKFHEAYAGIFSLLDQF